MEYDKQLVDEVVGSFGEVMFVLDSDREYIIHGREGYTYRDRQGGTFVRAEGMKGDEYVVVEFPLDAIEHHYKHKEL